MSIDMLFLHFVGTSRSNGQQVVMKQAPTVIIEFMAYNRIGAYIYV